MAKTSTRLILNATKYGLFVELDNLFVEGLGADRFSLRDDHYTYRENTREIIGARHHRKYTMGQRVRVLLDRIDSVQRRLQFSLIEDENSPTAPQRVQKEKKQGKEKQRKDKKQRKAKKPASPPAGHRKKRKS